ncbi:MAG TPA: FecR domain-containing protein [Steroidobacteraceae bacterium]|nr:FecR domain-containing protein [Steroidobacteraceae bacterium]
MTPQAARSGSALTPGEQASRWLVRQDLRELSPEESNEFDAWMRHPPHADAYRRARQAWDVFEQGPDDPKLRAIRDAALAAGPGAARWSWRNAGVAAGLLVLFVGGAALIWLPKGLPSTATVSASLNSDPLAQVGEPDYATRTGERRDVMLPDGSFVKLNTDTALDIAFSPSQRLVHLRRGQAFFEVTKNPARPFVVQAANRRVRAVGTAFDVRISPDRFQVVLAEGEVHVEQDKLTATSGTSPEVSLTAGQTLVAALGAPEEVLPVNVRKALRWRDGFVEFNDERFGAAVAEMNRYARQPVAIHDERVASLRISGVFGTDQPGRFLEVASELLPIEVERVANAPPEIKWREKR